MAKSCASKSPCEIVFKNKRKRKKVETSEMMLDCKLKNVKKRMACKKQAYKGMKKFQIWIQFK